ncbi:MAG: hypothetical protein K0R45_467 [Pseudomonas sp.]|nr:hypothetical protein [Pseudomonas sp.]
MGDTPIIERIDTPHTLHAQPPQNVHGWERIGSLAGGVLMMGKGLRRGGIVGLVQLAIGGAALARGITGHCSAKSKLEQGRSNLRAVRTDIERAGAELSQLKDDAVSAARTSVSNGIDSLKDPKPGL